MAAKKKYYNKKLQEKRMEILKNIIQEEIDLFLSEQDDGDSYDSMGAGGGATYSPGYGFGGGYGYGGGGGGDGKGVLFPWRRGSSASALTGDIVPKVGTILARGASTLATQAISGLKKAVLGTISALLPFNDPRATKRLLDGITNWEQRQVGAIDQHFAPGMKMIEEDWSHFKDDFWGIGFMASPANAIAAAVAGGKALDAALSIGNVLSGGRLGGAIEDLTPGGKVHEAAETENKGSVSDAFNKAMSGQLKPTSDISFGEALKKFKAAGGSEETIKELAQLASKDPKIIEAGQKLMAPQLEATLDGIIKDMVDQVSKGQIKTTPEELKNLKTNLEGYLSKIVVDSAKKKGITLTQKDLQTNPAFKQGVQKASQELAKIPAVPPTAPQQQPQTPAAVPTANKR